MNGLPSISLSLTPSELEDLKARVVTGQATPKDILALVLEIENVHVQIKVVRDWMESYCSISNKINEECYKHDPSLTKIQDWTDELRYGLGPPRGVNIDRMQALLAQVLHKVDVAGEVKTADKVILDIRRLLYDADLIKRR